MTAKSPNEELPTNVHSEEQLENLPSECLTGDSHRPLRHVDDSGTAYTYSLNPMKIVRMVLVVEAIERFSFYGVYYTQTLYLTGVYNEDWNAGFTSVQAASFVSASTAVAYTTPCCGAILADTVLGDYASIVTGAGALYLPGLLLVALTSVPHLLGETFNLTALSVAVLFLWPLGTGMVKSVVNVFGAKQFHPILQSSSIESYYVSFYTSINIGALVGITFIPILAQKHVTAAYLLPVLVLGLGGVLFLIGTPHYVRSKPRGDISICSPASTQHHHQPQQSLGSTTVPLSTIFRISLLIVPFSVAYSQMPTTFVVQGTVMKEAFGVIDAATMNSVDALSVLLFGYLTGSWLYPYLTKRGIKLRTTYKFAIGSFLATLSLCWSLWVETMIHQVYRREQRQISVLWQTPCYVLIGCGEIFAVSAAYEVAFKASAPQTKALASAINIFCVGGIPNLICIFLYHACKSWFRNNRGTENIHLIDDYVTAHVSNYFLVLVGISLFGVVVNVLKPVSDFVDEAETVAADLVKSPALNRGNLNNEATPLLKKRFGETPFLNRSGSLRATMSQRGDQQSSSLRATYGIIPRLYKTTEG